tara:strand:- start:66 stop:554 length:489 start_codon:yes stop_codon:yes gene_type:complete
MSLNYFTKYKCENFFDFQDDLIKLIYEDKNGKSDNNIFKTSYFSKEKGEWFDLFKDKVLKKFSLWFIKNYQVDFFACETCWYQIYEQNDFHEMHTHAHTNFTNVFYLQLPSEELVTKMKQNFTAEEGDLISFPGFVPHESPKNIYKKHKIIISFNSSIKIGE